MSRCWIRITDFLSPELDVYARLTENQLSHYYEPYGGLFLAESEKVIVRALEAGYEPVSLLMEESYAQKAPSFLERLGEIPFYVADESVLSQLTGYVLTRGVLCAMKRKPLVQLEEVVRGARRLVVMESVMNPANVGAIFRNAAALGMDGVILSPGSSDPLYRRALRVSMGNVLCIPWTFGGDDFPQRLRDLGFSLVGMALREDSLELGDPRLGELEKMAIILGTEGEGLTQKTLSQCDYVVRIPMARGVDSLNVAAASAVAFWGLGR